MCSTSIAFDSTTRAGLLLEARKGDRESLAKLILPYGPALYLGALRLTRNPAEAEDVRQEAFLKAISRLEQFNGSQEETRDDLHAWVSRIAANASRRAMYQLGRAYAAISGPAFVARDSMAEERRRVWLTGHLSAISNSLSRCSSVRSPSK